jgi:hypothetical protein
MDNNNNNNNKFNQLILKESERVYKRTHLTKYSVSFVFDA